MKEVISNGNLICKVDGYELYMDRAFASLVLASTRCEPDKIREFYTEYRRGYRSVAEYFANNTPFPQQLIEDYLTVKGEQYGRNTLQYVHLFKEGRTYWMECPWNIGNINPEGTSFYPNKAQKQLRSTARQNLMKRIQNLYPGTYNNEFSLGANILIIGAKVLGIDDLSIVEKMLNGEEPELPKPEQPEPQKPAKPAREKVVEKVVVQTETTPLEDMLKAAVSGMIAQVAIDDMVPRIKQRLMDEFGIEPIKHTVIDISKDTERDVPGVVHEAFDTVCHFIKNDVPIMLYGPSGTGKGYLCEQVATALGLNYYFMNSVTEEYKINGFVDINGDYHPSEFYRAFTEGGLFFLDEIDASAPEVLVCLNAAIANRYFTFPNGFKKAHENFRVVAAGNTLGTGADASYTGRMQLDAASLNRFVVVPVGYDENIDLLSAEGDTELVAFAKAYRTAAKKCGLATICSYRNIKQIKTAEPAMELKDALLFCLTKEMNKDDINIMVNEISRLVGHNRYLEALRTVEPMI